MNNVPNGCNGCPNVKQTAFPTGFRSLVNRLEASHNSSVVAYGSAKGHRFGAAPPEYARFSDGESATPQEITSTFDAVQENLREIAAKLVALTAECPGRVDASADCAQ